MEWISVKDRLPEIPEGQYGIQVLIAEYDSCYAECCNTVQAGYSVHQVSYHYITEEDRKRWGWGDEIKADFMELFIGGPEGSEWGPLSDEITHWMYLPEPPIYEGK